MDGLTIPDSIFQDLLAQAKEEAPIEACGILAGKDGEATKFYRMTNADNSSEHFNMLPKEQFKVVKDIRALGLVMLAVYHSHPASPARPSEEDIRYAVNMDTPYVILSLLDPDQPDIKGFRIEDGEVTAVPVQLQ